MKNIFLLMTILLIFSCNKNELDLLELKNTNEIVETVIKADSLKV
jgi:hypothetical protein